MKITEQDLIDFGFDRTDVPPEESGDSFDWHYYTLTLCNVEFITLGSNEIIDDTWNIEFFNSYPPIKIKDIETFKILYNTLKSIEDSQDIN